jgi:hypothetical protein
MIWSVLLIILITLLSLTLVLLSLILLPPITFGATASLRPEKKMALIEGSWFHPIIVSFSFDVVTQDVTVAIFGRKLFKRKNRDSKKRDSHRGDIKTGTSGSNAEATNADEVVSSVPVREEKLYEHRIKKDESPSGSDQQQNVPSEINEAKPDTISLVSPTSGIQSDDTLGIEKKADGANGNEKITSTQDNYKPSLTDENGKTGESDQSTKRNEVREKSKTVTEKESFLTRLKRNRYLYMIRQDKLLSKLFRWVLRVFKSLFKIIRFDHFHASVKAGIEEPALLGKVYAFYTMTRYTVNVSKGNPIIGFEPVFMKNYLEGEATFRLKTAVIVLLWPGVIALATFPYFTVLWLFWKSRKLKKTSATKKSKK